MNTATWECSVWCDPSRRKKSLLFLPESDWIYRKKHVFLPLWHRPVCIWDLTALFILSWKQRARHSLNLNKAGTRLLHITTNVLCSFWTQVYSSFFSKVLLKGSWESGVSFKRQLSGLTNRYNTQLVRSCGPFQLFHFCSRCWFLHLCAIF